MCLCSGLKTGCNFVFVSYILWFRNVRISLKLLQLEHERKKKLTDDKREKRTTNMYDITC